MTAPAENHEHREWSRKSLKELVDERGITYGVVQPGHAAPDGVPMLRVNNFAPEGLRLDDVLRIDAAVESKYNRSRLKGGEVLVTLVGSVGLVAMVPDHLAGWNVARAVGVVPVKDPLLARWVSMCLRTPEAIRHLDARLNTTVQKTLNLKDLAGLEIPIPPEHELRRIVCFVEALDDKIRSNLRLSMLHQDTFMSWWASVAATAEGDAVQLSAIATAHKDKADISQPYIGLDQMPRGSTVLTEWLTDDAPAASVAFRTGDILFGKLRPYFRKVGIAPLDGRCSTEILVLRPSNPELYGLVLGHAFSQQFIDHCKTVSTGTRMPRAEWRMAGTYPIRVPDEDALHGLTGLAETVYAHVRRLTHESRRLHNIRDELLPRLVSGKIRVPAAEEIAEAGDEVALEEAAA